VLAALGAASTVLAGGLQVDFLAAPDGVPLCVAEAGNPAGPPLVFIHGYSQTYAVFQRQFDSDLARDFRLIALDMRGHGCSGKPWSESAYAGARPWADDIAAVLKAKAVTRPLLVGWSAGGYWIADYLREHGTGGVAGVVLAGSHGGLMSAAINPALPEMSKAMRAANQAYPPDVAQALAKGEQFVPLMSARPLPDDVARTMYAATLMLPAYARRAMATRTMDNADLVPRLRLPVLFIHGEQDRVATPDQMRSLVAQLPDASLSLFPDTGHATFAEQPERFNREIAEFAARVRPGRQP
jgi:pimeloyl-ACP methyl ester carboxylesterase